MHFVELHIAAAGLRERRDLGAKRGGEVVVEIIKVGIGGAVDGVAAAAGVDEARRRQRDLGGALRRRAQKLEIVDGDVAAVLDLAVDLEHQRRIVLLQTMEHVGELTAPPDDAVDLGEKIDVKRRAPEIAIGDGEKARLLPAAAPLRECRRLRPRAARPADSRPAFMRGAGVLELLRTQQAADLVGPQGRQRRRGLR